MSDAYRTMDFQYVESIWWAVKTIYDKGLLVRAFRSSYQRQPAGLGDDALDAGVQHRRGGPHRTRVRGRPPGRRREKVVVAESLRDQVLGEGWDALATVRGAELLGATYDRPFSMVEIPDAHYVVAGDFVTTEDGTGLVHIASAFGADDMEVSRLNGLPVVNPVRPYGRLEDHLPMVGGLFFKDVNAPLITDLADRGLLFRSETHAHSYPHCWRCKTALLYYALPSWYIRTTAVKEQMIAENEKVNWQPATIKEGRYGEWLRTNVDWALSRMRYWGTPLPLWECPNSHLTCVESLADLSRRAGVDDVTLPCPQCATESRRVPEVIDAWFDSGSMPSSRPIRPSLSARRSTRPGAYVRTRQPLPRALADSPRFASLPPEMLALIADELKVTEVAPLDAGSPGSLVDYVVKPQFRALGRRFGSSTQAVAAASTAVNPEALAQAIASEKGTVSLKVSSLGTVEITEDDVVITQTPREGWGVATVSGETVALDLSVSPALHSAGWSREAIRFIQDVRKSDGLNVTDRIVVRWAVTDPGVAQALAEHGELIGSEVLAVEFEPASGTGPVASGAERPPQAWRELADDGLGLRIWLAATDR